MSRFRLYLKTFDALGNYNTDFQEITKYAEKLGDVSLDTDSSEFQIGVFTNSNISITLDNREGQFSDVGQPASIFKYKRGNSIVKITYDRAEYKFLAGSAIAGESILNREVELFEGILNDDSTVENAKVQSMQFTLLGYESVFENEIVPFSLISAGQMVSDVIYAILNQANITQFLTVDLANIVPGLDQTLDNVTVFENLTVKDALNRLLNASNSVFQIIGNTVYVKDRAPSIALIYTFYGQASQSGKENIMDVKNITNGISRTFNFVSWKDTSLAFAVNDSIRLNGIKKKEVEFEFFTNTVKRLNILESIATEFGNKKQELDLVTDLNYDTLDIDLLDKVNIDYPTITIPWENFDLPICGQAICGEAVLPQGLWALTIDPGKFWKVISKKISISKYEMTFKLREI